MNRRKIYKEIGLESLEGKIKIVVRKVWYRGEPRYEVLHVKAVREDSLPISYFSMRPHAYALDMRPDDDHALTTSTTILRVVYSENNKDYVVDIVPGRLYEKELFRKLLIAIKQAGENLTEITNKNLEIYQKGWEGIYSIEI